MIDDVRGRWSPARYVSTSDAERLSDDDTDCGVVTARGHHTHMS